MEHREKKNQMDRPTFRHNGFVKNIIEGKIEGEVLRGRPRDKYMGQIKKEAHRKKYQEVS
jgi:hypothetical protein